MFCFPFLLPFFSPCLAHAALISEKCDYILEKELTTRPLPIDGAITLVADPRDNTFVVSGISAVVNKSFALTSKNSIIRVRTYLYFLNPEGFKKLKSSPQVLRMMALAQINNTAAVRGIMIADINPLDNEKGATAASRAEIKLFAFYNDKGPQRIGGSILISERHYGACVSRQIFR